MAYKNQFQASKREAYRTENYKGKNPMSRSQWRRHRRIKKAERELAMKEIGESNNSQFSSNMMVTNKPPVGRKLFSPRGKGIAKKSPEK